ncbi:division/cell wall cluster transcriptional repressor MraZ [Mycoplasma tauri]|uniref:division/cell wall cluster transcriptional repressor MraZ n=1 Tax=Mycoplasma tauri TaxID=547987 RepID=UPI001CC19EE3|nr:division/cell wall cluster transcriptional repressor MraZ [Mycoplasma tauri]MBZ4203640.1 division/cell wall cluster transcriptional repressor MraZ [Mycoplasma tauri]
MYGQFTRQIDAKNRIAIPTKLRDGLGVKFYITIGLDNVIELRSEESFSAFSTKLISQSQFSTEARLIRRAWLGKTQEIELDSQGRFIIPKQYLSHAAIQKEVLLIGVGDLVELWGVEKYAEYESNLDVNSIQIAAQKLAEKE